MRSESPTVEFAAHSPSVPAGTESLDGLLSLLVDREIEVWCQGGQVKARPADRLDDAARAAMERYRAPLLWALERRLNPAWWRRPWEIWFGDYDTAVEFGWRKRREQS